MTVLRRLEIRELDFGTTQVELPLHTQVMDAVVIPHPFALPSVHLVLATRVVPDNVDLGKCARIFIVCADGAEFEAGRHRHIRSLVAGDRVLHVLERL